MAAYCLLAGLGDATTGLLLLLAPIRVAALLGIAPAPPFYLSFVGAFVLAVGLSYLYPFALAAPRRPGRLLAALEITAIARLSVASFLAASLAAGSGVRGFVPVLATDLSLAAFQLLWLSRRGAGEQL